MLAVIWCLSFIEVISEKSSDELFPVISKVFDMVTQDILLATFSVICEM